MWFGTHQVLFRSTDWAEKARGWNEREITIIRHVVVFVQLTGLGVTQRWADVRQKLCLCVWRSFWSRCCQLANPSLQRSPFDSRPSLCLFISPSLHTLLHCPTSKVIFTLTSCHRLAPIWLYGYGWLRYSCLWTASRKTKMGTCFSNWPPLAFFPHTSTTSPSNSHPHCQRYHSCKRGNCHAVIAEWMLGSDNIHTQLANTQHNMHIKCSNTSWL